MITPRATFIKELVEPEHQLFHHRIQSCSYNLDRHHLSRVLIDNMIHHEGIGISANQIGIWERAFAMVRDLENNEVMVCFNPRIIKSYSEEVEMEEGCLSYPELFLKRLFAMSQVVHIKSKMPSNGRSFNQDSNDKRTCKTRTSIVQSSY